MAFGTARIASCDDTIITGKIIRDIVNAAARTDFPNESASIPPPRTNNVNPNKPNTTDGTDARFAIFTLTKRVKKLSLAYSSI